MWGVWRRRCSFGSHGSKFFAPKNIFLYDFSFFDEIFFFVIIIICKVGFFFIWDAKFLQLIVIFCYSFSIIVSLRAVCPGTTCANQLLATNVTLYHPSISLWLSHTGVKMG